MNRLRQVLVIALFALVPALVRAENVCVTCHGGLAARYSAPVPLWQGSIHAQNGIFCNDCHGGNPADAALAMSPAQGFIGVPAESEIPGVCGKCHVGILAEYARSAHGEALGAGGPSCVTCHGNHAVVAPSLAMINEGLCGRCHSFARAAAIRAILEQGEAEITRLQGEIRRHARTGIDTARQEKGLFEARNRYRSLMHELDGAKLRDGSAHLEGELRRIDRELGEIAETLQMRKLWGGGAIGLLLVLALLFHLLGRSYAQKA